MITQTGVKIVGYGPPGLLKAVREAKWRYAAPSGENFAEISIGDYCLSRPAEEEGCSLCLEVTVRSEEEQVTVKGWAFPGALMAAQCAVEAEGGSSVFGGPVKLTKSPITKEPTEQNTTRYEIDITPL